MKETDINENNKYLHFVRQACRQRKLKKIIMIIIIIIIIVIIIIIIIIIIITIIINSLNIAPLDIKMIKSARGRSKIV